MQRKGNTLKPLVGMYIGPTTMENSVQIPQKTKKEKELPQIQQSHYWTSILGNP